MIREFREGNRDVLNTRDLAIRTTIQIKRIPFMKNLSSDKFPFYVFPALYTIVMDVFRYHRNSKYISYVYI